MKIFYIICILFSSIGFSQSIEYLNYHIDTKFGLPDKEIYNIVNDDKGFVWLATNSGLYRFDGVNFKQYKHKSQGKSSVFGLKRDKKNRLWFNTINGDYYFVENDSVHHFKSYIKDSDEFLRAFSIIENNLYISFSNKILGCNILTKQEKEYPLLHHKTTTLSTVNKINNKLVVADSKFLFEINTTEGKIPNNDYRVTPTTLVYKNNLIVHSVFKDRKNKFTLINEKQQHVLEGLNEVEETTFHAFKLINNDLWIFTSKGAYRYRIKSNKCIHIDTYLKGKDVTDAIIDDNENLLFTTLSYGLYVIPNLSIKTVKQYKNDEYITDFEVINDSIITYIEAKEELIKINTKNSHKQKLKLKNLNQKLYYNKETDKLYVFEQNLAYILDANNIQSDYKISSLGIPKDIIQLNKNQLLLSYYNQLKIVNTNDFSVKNYFEGRCKKLAFNRYNNTIYVGFAKGLKAGSEIENLKNVLFNNEKIYVKSISVKPNSPETFVLTDTNNILILKDDTCVGSLYNSSEYVISTLACSKDNLFIGTDKGVLQYDYKTKRISLLNSIPLIQINSIKFSEHKIWITTDTQIITIPKQYIEKQYTTKLKPYFSEVLLDNKLVNPNKPILIKDNKQSLTTTFMLNGFRALENVFFEYKIGGGYWQKQSGNKLTLTSLPYGKQILAIRAINKHNQDITEVSSIQLNILRPFYLTWWFVTLSGIFLVMLIIKMIIYINKKQAQKKIEEIENLKKQREFTNLKLENLRSQMNPHFIFNALNSIQEYIFANEKKLASSYLVKFSRLIRIYLEQSQQSEITLKKEIEALDLYLHLENNRFDKQLNYQVEIDKSLDLENILVPSLFIQPYVENAIKHGLLHKKGDKNLIISFNYNRNKNQLEVMIDDNGIGRVSSRKHNENRPYKSFSTEASLNRVELINVRRSDKLSVNIIDKVDENSNALGTQVNIVIPLNCNV